MSQFEHVTSERSLFESHEKQEKVKQIWKRSFDHASAIEYRDAAKDLLNFNIEKAMQFYAVDMKALDYLEKMELKYTEMVKQEKTAYEKEVKELKEKWERSKTESETNFHTELEKIKKQLEKEKQIEIERIRKDEKEAYERRFQELLQATFKLNFVAEGTFATAINAGHGATTSSGAEFKSETSSAKIKEFNVSIDTAKIATSIATATVQIPPTLPPTPPQIGSPTFNVNRGIPGPVAASTHPDVKLEKREDRYQMDAPRISQRYETNAIGQSKQSKLAKRPPSPMYPR